MQIFFWWGQFQVVSIFLVFTRATAFIQTTHISLLLLSFHASLEIVLLQLCEIKFKLALSRTSLVRINVFGHTCWESHCALSVSYFRWWRRERERDGEMPHRNISIFQWTTHNKKNEMKRPQRWKQGMPMWFQCVYIETDDKHWLIKYFVYK